MAWLTRFLLPFGLLAVGCSAPAPGPARDWDAAFQHRAGFGWSGGDAASSVPLPGARVLWLFGDSYLSDVEGGQRQHVEFRFGNTVAIEENVAPGVAPSASDMKFDWASGDSNGWMPISPSMLEDPAAPESARTAAAEQLRVLSWPLHGSVVGTDLVLWNAVVTSSGCDPCGPFSFKVHGTVASVVPGVDRPYADWGFVSGSGWQPGHEPEQHFVPASRAGAALDDTSGTIWGTFVMRDVQDPATLYVYGNRRGATTSDLVVARIRGAVAGKDAVAFDRWTFWDGQSWTSSADAAASIAPDSAAEVSVLPVPDTWGGGFALVASGELASGTVRVSLSSEPWGPFVLRYTLHLADCPVEGFDPARENVTYAGKAHPELGTEDEMLLSLVTVPKTTGLAPVLTDVRTYAPRFIRLPWAEVMSNDRSSIARCNAG